MVFNSFDPRRSSSLKWRNTPNLNKQQPVSRAKLQLVLQALSSLASIVRPNPSSSQPFPLSKTQKKGFTTKQFTSFLKSGDNNTLEQKREIIKRYAQPDVQEKHEHLKALIHKSNPEFQAFVIREVQSVNPELAKALFNQTSPKNHSFIVKYIPQLLSLSKTLDESTCFEIFKSYSNANKSIALNEMVSTDPDKTKRFFEGIADSSPQACISIFNGLTLECQKELLQFPLLDSKLTLSPTDSDDAPNIYVKQKRINGAQLLETLSEYALHNDIYQRCPNLAVQPFGIVVEDPMPSGLFSIKMCMEKQSPCVDIELSQLLDLKNRIEEMHKKEIAHGDIEATNFAKNEDGQLLLIDFEHANSTTSLAEKKIPITHLQKIH